MIEYAIYKRGDKVEIVIFESEGDHPLLFKFDISLGGEVRVEDLRNYMVSIDYAESKEEVIEIVMVVLRDEGCLPTIPDLEYSLKEHIPDDYPGDLGEGLDYKDLPSFSP